MLPDCRVRLLLPGPKLADFERRATFSVLFAATALEARETRRSLLMNADLDSFLSVDVAGGECGA